MHPNTCCGWCSFTNGGGVNDGGEYTRSTFLAGKACTNVFKIVLVVRIISHTVLLVTSKIESEAVCEQVSEILRQALGMKHLSHCLSKRRSRVGTHCGYWASCFVTLFTIIPQANRIFAHPHVCLNIVTTRAARPTRKYRNNLLSSTAVTNYGHNCDFFCEFGLASCKSLAQCRQRAVSAGKERWNHRCRLTSNPTNTASFADPAVQWWSRSSTLTLPSARTLHARSCGSDAKKRVFHISDHRATVKFTMVKQEAWDTFQLEPLLQLALAHAGFCHL